MHENMHKNIQFCSLEIALSFLHKTTPPPRKLQWNSWSWVTLMEEVVSL